MIQYSSWKNLPSEHPDTWVEMEWNFVRVQTNHIRLVSKNLYLLHEHFLSVNDATLTKELILRVNSHDNSKWEEPEHIPYVWRYWRTKWRADGAQEATQESHTGKWDSVPFHLHFQDPTLDQAIRDAVFHHITHNRHHPEWHLDPDDMTNADIIEMVCDWYAMSQEFNSSIDEWVSYVVPRRYAFGNKIPYILNTIELLKRLSAEVGGNHGKVL